MPLKEEVGRRVRRARERAGLTLQALADRTGIETTTLSRYETARRACSLKMLERVAAALQVDVDSLLVENRKAMPGLRKDEEELLRSYRTLSTKQRRIATWMVRELHKLK